MIAELEHPRASNVTDTLKDMVELQMYLAAQTFGKPWPLLPRGTQPYSREPCCCAVDLSIVEELVDRGFIERTSSQTFVVSKSGREFYLREMKPAIPVVLKSSE
jgi:hypothetical protein